MQFTPRLKQGLGLVLMAIFGLIQVLFIISLVDTLLKETPEKWVQAGGCLFCMGLFFVPLRWSYLFWKSGRNQLRRKAKAQQSLKPIADDATATVQIQTKIELSDYRKLIFFQTYTNPMLMFIHVIGLGSLTFYFVENGAHWFFCGIQILILFLPFSVYRASQSNYKTSKMLHEPVTYEFTHETIRATGDSFNTTMQWQSLHKVKELKRWFLLYSNKQVAMLIPKSSFNSPDDMTVFRPMMHSVDIE